MAVTSKLFIACALLAMLVFGLAACTRQAVTPVIEDASAAAPESAGQSEAGGRSEALIGLIQKASQAYSAGEHERAIDLAERGLRMDRYAPELYLILAQGYQGLGLKEQSVSFARLGLRYSAANPALKPLLQALIGAE